MFWADNNGKNLAEAQKIINGKVETIEMDVSKIEDFEKLKSKIIKEFGGQYSPYWELSIFAS